MARLFPFWHRSAGPAPSGGNRDPGRVPVLTLQERRLLLGILFLFALGLAGRAIQLRTAALSPTRPAPSSQEAQPPHPPGAPP